MSLSGGIAGLRKEDEVRPLRTDRRKLSQSTMHGCCFSPLWRDGRKNLRLRKSGVYGFT